MNKFLFLTFIFFIIFVYYINNINGYDLLDYINYINNQWCENKAFYDTQKIEWCINLRNNWTVIRDEYINYCKQHELTRFKDIDDNQKNFDVGEKGWYVAFLKVYGSYTNLVNIFPKTYNLIKNIPGCTLAMFSTIDPEKVIPDHIGPYNGVLRYHLCLISDEHTPENCYIVVNYIKYHWIEGKDVLFDDFMYHCVTNNNKSKRVVLFLDIKKEFNNMFLNYINNMFLVIGSKNITKESIVGKTNDSLLK